jgi:hypothetical protein
MFGAGGTDDMSPARLGDLHREVADTAGGAHKTPQQPPM